MEGRLEKNDKKSETRRVKRTIGHNYSNRFSRTMQVHLVSGRCKYWWFPMCIASTS